MADLAPGQSGIITITGQVDASNIIAVYNTVRIVSNEIDTNNSNNSSNAYVLITASIADLSINKTVNPVSATLGQFITYTVAYSNAGNATATGVVITDIVPSSLTAVSYQSTGAVITTSGNINYVWNVTDLPPEKGGVITTPVAIPFPTLE